MGSSKVRIEGQRIKLTNLDESDLSLFIEMFTCPNQMQHVYNPGSVAEAKIAFLDKSKPWSYECDHWLTFAIEDLTTGEKLGNIGLRVTNQNDRVAEVGFMIKATAQGKGIASEALALVINYAFDVINLQKLIAYCSTLNTNSFKLLEKFAFTREALLKKNTLINDNYVDDYAYGLCSTHR